MVVRPVLVRPSKVSRDSNDKNGWYVRRLPGTWNEKDMSRGMVIQALMKFITIQTILTYLSAGLRAKKMHLLIVIFVHDARANAREHSPGNE